MSRLPPLCTLDLQIAALVGYHDEMLGLGFLDNPYPQDSTQARQWVDGYVRSMIERRGNPHG